MRCAGVQIISVKRYRLFYTQQKPSILAVTISKHENPQRDTISRKSILWWFMCAPRFLSCILADAFDHPLPGDKSARDLTTYDSNGGAIICWQPGVKRDSPTYHYRLYHGKRSHTRRRRSTRGCNCSRGDTSCAGPGRITVVTPELTSLCVHQPPLSALHHTAWLGFPAGTIHNLTPQYYRHRFRNSYHSSHLLFQFQNSSRSSMDVSPLRDRRNYWQGKEIRKPIFQRAAQSPRKLM